MTAKKRLMPGAVRARGLTVWTLQPSTLSVASCGYWRIHGRRVVMLRFGTSRTSIYTEVYVPLWHIQFTYIANTCKYSVIMLCTSALVLQFRQFRMSYLTTPNWCNISAWIWIHQYGYRNAHVHRLKEYLKLFLALNECQNKMFIFVCKCYIPNTQCQMHWHFGLNCSRISSQGIKQLSFHSLDVHALHFPRCCYEKAADSSMTKHLW